MTRAFATNMATSVRRAAAFIAWMAVSCACWAQGDLPPEQLVPVFRGHGAAFSNEDGRRLDAIRSGRWGAFQQFEAWASISLGAEPHPQVSRSLPLGLEKAAAPGGEAAEWQRYGEFSIWRDRGELSQLATALVLPRGEPVELARFDEMWIDYASLTGIADCQVHVDLFVAADGGARTLLSTGADRLAERKAIDVAASVWKPKELAYVFSRQLGFAFDADWRFAQDGLYVVVQRRMHEPLADVAALGIALLPNTVAEQVNLRVSVGGASRVLEFPGLSKLELSDTRGIRLDLLPALEAAFPREFQENLARPGAHTFFLDEVNIFLHGRAATVAQERAVRRVSFLGVAASQGGDAPAALGRIASNTARLDALQDRLTVDLRKLDRAARLRLVKAQVRLAPPSGGSACAAQVNAASLVAVSDVAVPMVATRGGAWLKAHGGPFGTDPRSANPVETLALQGFLAFETMAPPPPTPASKPAERAEQEPAAPVTNPAPTPEPKSPERAEQGLRQPPHPGPGYRVEGGRPLADAAMKSWASPEGAMLRGAAITAAAMPKTHALAIEGSAPEWDLVWPIGKRLGRDVVLYLEMPAGAEQVARITLTVVDQAGKAHEHAMRPNMAVRGLFDDSSVREIRLHFIPAVRPFKVDLQSLSLFEPRSGDMAQAAAVKLPVRVKLRPEVTSAARNIVTREAGRIRALESGDPLVFESPISPPMASPAGISLRYRLPADVFRDNPCAITLRLRGRAVSFERGVCLDRPGGEVWIAFSDLLPAAHPPLDGLESIEWTLPPGTRGASEEAYDLDFAVEGWSWLSGVEEILGEPVFERGAHRQLLPADRVAAWAGRLSQRAWIPLGPGAAQALLAPTGTLHVADHALFAVDEIALARNTPVDPAEWEATAAPAPVGSTSFSSWVFWGVVAAVAAALWASRRRLAGRFGHASATMTRVRAVAGVALRPLSRFGTLAFFVAEAGVAVALLFAAGRAARSFSGVALLAAVAVLSYAGHAQLGRWKAEGRVVHVPGAAYAAVAASLMLAIWGLGRYGATFAIAWAAAPLVATAFAAGPWLRDTAFGLYRTNRAALAGACFFAAAVAMYAVGWMRAPDSKENLMFTAGALLAAIAIAASILGAMPLLARFPRLRSTLENGRGAPFFATALLALPVAGAAYLLGRSLAAEQLAVVIYWSLILGIAIEAWARRGGRRTGGVGRDGP